MSHANGLARFTDGTVRFFEYDGNTDVCLPKIWTRYADVRKHWREANSFRACTCGRPPEVVEVFTDYGRGIAWSATACRQCRVIVDCASPHDHKDVRNEVPEWARQLNLTSVQEEGAS